MVRSAHPASGPFREWRNVLLLLNLLVMASVLGAIIWQWIGQANSKTAHSEKATAPSPPSTKPIAAKLGSDSGASRRTQDESDVMRDQTNETIRATVTLVGLGFQGNSSIPSALALLREGENRHLWILEETSQAPPLNPRNLEAVEDSRPIAGWENNREAHAFYEALFKAHWTSTDAFANSARRDITYADLYGRPWEFRGQTVHVEGRLRRIRRFDPPNVARLQGVRDQYEGWIFDKLYGAHPICLVFTDLPAQLKVAEKMDQPVVFDGYFFKLYRYESADSKPGQARKAPLLIGRSPVLVEGNSASASTNLGWSSSLLGIFMTLLGVTILLAIFLPWWFRRGDQIVKARLAQASYKEFVDPSDVHLPPVWMDDVSSGDHPASAEAEIPLWDNGEHSEAPKKP